MVGAWLISACALRSAENLTPSVRYRWSNVAMGGAGFVSGIVHHPQVRGLLYARTDVGGAYRYGGGSAGWVPLLDWLPSSMASALGVESIALDPRAPDKVYLLTGTPYWRGGTNILASDDRGRTWRITDVSKQMRAHGNKWGRHTGERLVVDPNAGRILFCGSRTSGLWKSEDSGRNWAPVSSFRPGPEGEAGSDGVPKHPADTPNGNGICFVVMDVRSGKPGQPSQVLYVGLSRPYLPASGQDAGATGNVFRSEDGGKSWVALPALPEGSGPERQEQSHCHPCRAALLDGKLTVTFQAEKGSGGGVFRYDPAQQSWQDITPLVNAPKAKRLHVSYGGIDLLPGRNGEPSRLMVSTFGVYRPQKHRDGHTVWGECVFFSNRGNLETGEGWVDLFGKDRARLDPHLAFARRANLHWGAAVSLDPSDANRAYVTSGNGIWATSNLGESFKSGSDCRSDWKFFVRGLEESVPMDVISIPGGPLVSAIWDYAGFTQDRADEYSPHGQFSEAAGLNVKLASVGSGRRAGVLRLNAEGDMAWSMDSGVTWKALEKQALSKAGTMAGLALSADAKVILYSGVDRKVYRNEDPARVWPANGWKEVETLAGAHWPVADPVDSKRFYSYRGSSGELLLSEDGGRTFAPWVTVGHGANWCIRVVPGRRGEVWIAMYGKGIRKVSEGKVSEIRFHRCATLGFGRGRQAADHPSVYVWGQPLQADPEGLYRSTDEGKSWVRINDDLHQYGGLGNGGFVKGDMNVFGRVYQSTAGRGVAYGSPEP